MTVTSVVAGGREALIPLTLLGPGGRRAEIVAVLDTGFTGHPVLPSSVVGGLDGSPASRLA